MNVNQQLAFMRLRNDVEKVAPGKHVLTQRDLTIYFVLSCSCGWQHRVNRQNALARASKIRRAEWEHLNAVLARHKAERSDP